MYGSTDHNNNINVLKVHSGDIMIQRLLLLFSSIILIIILILFTIISNLNAFNDKSKQAFSFS